MRSCTLFGFLLQDLDPCFHNPNFGFVAQISHIRSLKTKLAKFYNIHYLVHNSSFSFNFQLNVSYSCLKLRDHEQQFSSISSKKMLQFFRSKLYLWLHIYSIFHWSLARFSRKACFRRICNLYSASSWNFESSSHELFLILPFAFPVYIFMLF